MRVAVLQPSYLPWLGYFDQIASVDAFVFYDDVQFDRNGWRNRNRIRTVSAEGWSWLTIPVLVQGFPKIIDVSIDARTPWRHKHLATLKNAYARAPFRSLLEAFDGFFASENTSLADVTIESVRVITQTLGIETPLYRSSELGIEGDRNTRLLAICEHFGADEYLSGVAAQAYLDIALFERAGIRVVWQSFEHPTYPQVHEPFVSHLSAIDALLCVGPAARAFVGDRKRVY